jgi:hypothetical protein
MANNIDIVVNGVTKTIATRDNAGVHTQVFGLDTTEQAQLGALTEAAPATDTASSGINGRLQRIAQHLTALIALFPAALTAGGNFKAAILEALPAGTNLLGKFGIDQTTPGTSDSVTVKAADGVGSLTEAAPATDTASSGLNGRLQRIAQRLTSLIALFPTALTAGGNFKTALLEAIPAGANLIGKVGIDQTTSGTTNAVYALETSDVLDLVLTTDTVAYATGDVLADTQELAGVMRINGGTAILQSLKITDKDDQGQAMDVVFLKSNVSLGLENSAVSIADADAVEILGIVSVAAADFVDLGGVRVATVAIPAAFILKAGAASTSIYVAAISRGTGTYTASGLSIKVGVVRM